MAALSDGIALDGNRSVEGRQPYEGGLTQCIGFEWCLPAEVGNEVQTDSVAFDLGFYAEQSRHNDDARTCRSTERPRQQQHHRKRVAVDTRLRAGHPLAPGGTRPVPGSAPSGGRRGGS